MKNIQRVNEIEKYSVAPHPIKKFTLPPPLISGTEGDEENLDPSYYKRSNPNEFFRVGKVFALLWHEQAGDNGTVLSPVGNSYYKVKHGEYVYSHIRRMVVVQEQRGCSWCLPIHTYGRRGSGKPGIDLEAHAIIHMEGEPPERTEMDAGIVKEPLEVKPDSRREKLHPLSRLNFSKVYTVEHNVKVKSIGRISKQSMPNFKIYWKEAFNQA